MWSTSTLLLVDSEIRVSLPLCEIVLYVPRKWLFTSITLLPMGPKFFKYRCAIHILQELQYKANHKQWLQMEKSACTHLVQKVTSQIFTGIHILTEAYRYGITICVSLMWYSILSVITSVLYFCRLSALDNIWGGFIYISLSSNVCNTKYPYYV